MTDENQTTEVSETQQQTKGKKVFKGEIGITRPCITKLSEKTAIQEGHETYVTKMLRDFPAALE